MRWRRIGLCLLLLPWAISVQARLEICNATDLVLLAAVGYHTAQPPNVGNSEDALEGWVFYEEEGDNAGAQGASPQAPVSGDGRPGNWIFHSGGRIATEGWWKIYPGYCEVPVDLTMFFGDYFVHVEADPRTTIPSDGFTWGENVQLCVKLADFRIPNNAECPLPGSLVVPFNKIKKSWNNENRIEITHPERSYGDLSRVRIAGVQRLLLLLGYDPGEVNGEIAGKTFDEMNKFAVKHQLFGLDPKALFFIMEEEFSRRVPK